MSKRYRLAVLTASDKGAVGERVDESGPLLCTLMQAQGYDVVQTALLPDDKDAISAQLLAWCQSGEIDLILTTGGTGLGPRDCAPEATAAVAERLVPGFGEAMRAHSMTITPRGMLSRGIAATCKSTLIVNLPGSPKAARENLDAILPALSHGLAMLTAASAECAQNAKD